MKENRWPPGPHWKGPSMAGFPHSCGMGKDERKSGGLKRQDPQYSCPQLSPEGAWQGKHLLVCMQSLGSAKPCRCGGQRGSWSNICSLPSAWTPCHPSASQKHTPIHTEIFTETYQHLSVHSSPSQPYSIKQICAIPLKISEKMEVQVVVHWAGRLNLPSSPWWRS